MKLTIERAALLKALAHVQSVVERRNTIPILSNVLVTAQKGRLSLAATDMDLAIRETVDASAAPVQSGAASGWQPLCDPRRPLALPPSVPAAGRFPHHGRR